MTVDLHALLRRNEALERLAVSSTYRRLTVPKDCGEPLTVLPAMAPFPGPLAVYSDGGGGLWFEVQGEGVSAYANPERVNDANIYQHAVFR